MIRRLVLLSCLVGCAFEGAPAGEGLPENLARRARAWASSEFSQQYLARFAVDGKVHARVTAKKMPSIISQYADEGNRRR